MKINVANILDNPHRDLQAFPYNEAKIKHLMDSIGKLGFWDNVIARPQNNQINGHVITSQEDLMEFLGSADFAEIMVELAYGHHRIEAIRRINASPKYENIEVVDIPIKWLDDDKMLQVMVHENRNEWGHGISVMVESVSKVYDTICKQLDEFSEDEFEKYLDKYGHIDNSKAFKRAKGEQGVGYQTVQSYIGGEWKDNDIRGPLAAIKASRAGLFEIEDCYVMNSGSSLLEMVKLIEAIYEERSVPQYYKDKWAHEAFKLQQNPEEATPVKVLKTAKVKVKNGFDPLTYMQKKQSMKIDATALIAETLWEKEIFDLAGALAIDGLEGWTDEIEEAVKRVQSRKKRKDAGGSLDDAGSNDASPMDNAGVPPASEGDEPDLSNLDASTITGSDKEVYNTADHPAVKAIGSVIQVFNTSAPVFLTQTERLIGRIAEVDPEDIKFFEQLEKNFLILASLYMEAHGKDRTIEALDALATMAEERLKKAKAATEDAATEDAATEDEATGDADTKDEATEDDATGDADTEDDATEETPKLKGKAALVANTKGKGKKTKK
ncbi:MAG TPA: hypothetical protein VLM20_00430 [Methylophilaceae bacterium]|nr:hypothetical protein [Methylophilaceae bacterium]